jgi:hypothetical protein
MQPESFRTTKRGMMLCDGNVMLTGALKQYLLQADFFLSGTDLYPAMTLRGIALGVCSRLQ